jgi:hypothetical protein
MTCTPALANMDVMRTATYVRDLDAAVVGPRRVKRGLLREAGDHLEDATEAYRAAGYDVDAAQAMAVADFGSVREIAPSFQTTLAVASARRTAWMLFGVLSIQPFLWDGPLGPHEPQPDGLAFATLDTAVEWGGGLMLVTSFVLLLANGIGNRWFKAGRGIARLTSVTTIGAALSIQLSGMAMVLLAGRTHPVAWLMLATFIVVPLSLTAAQARRTLAAC